MSRTEKRAENETRAEPARASGRIDPGSGKPLPGPLLAGPKPMAQASGRERSALRRAATALGALLVRGLSRVLVATARVRVVEGAEHLTGGQGPLVLAFWHEALAPGLVFLDSRAARALGPQAVLVSPSIDGDLPARVLERGGRRVVRGSATRSGVKALRDLHRVAARERVSPLVLPDGPRGPAREAKLGPLLLAQLAQVPVLPLGFALSPGPRVPSWDRMLVPLPFARIAVAVGAPLAPPASMDSAELEERRVEPQRALERLTERANAR